MGDIDNRKMKATNNRLETRSCICCFNTVWSVLCERRLFYDIHRAKVTVGAYMWASSCRSLFWRKIGKITELFGLFWQF